MKFLICSFLIVFFFFPEERPSVRISIEVTSGDTLNRFTTTAQNSYKWLINGKPIKYIQGDYLIPISKPESVDTLVFLESYSEHPYDHKPNKSGRPFRATTLYYCKFRKSENYKLSEGHPFALYSMDNVSTRISYTFTIQGMKPGDTIYCNGPTRYQEEITRDTTFTDHDENKDSKRSTRVHFALHSTVVYWGSYDRFYSDLKPLMEFRYLFLSGEHIDVVYDHTTKQTHITAK